MLYEKELLCNLFPVKVGFHFAFTYFTMLIICLMTGPSRNQSVLFLSTNFNVSLGSTSRNIEFIRKQNKRLFTLKPVIESCTLFFNLIFGTHRASDISRKKSKISRDFQGQICEKIGRFREIFAGEKSKFAEKSANFAGF